MSKRSFEPFLVNAFIAVLVETLDKGRDADGYLFST